MSEQQTTTAVQALDHRQSFDLSESDAVGAGNLHSYLVLGHNHQSSNDAQVDINLTLAN